MADKKLEKLVTWCVDRKNNFGVTDRSRSCATDWSADKLVNNKVLRSKNPMKKLKDILSETEENMRRIYITLPREIYNKSSCRDSWDASSIWVGLWEGKIEWHYSNDFGLPLSYECHYCDVIDSCPSLRMLLDGHDGKSSEDNINKMHEWAEEKKKNGSFGMMKHYDKARGMGPIF